MFCRYVAIALWDCMTHCHLIRQGYALVMYRTSMVAAWHLCAAPFGDSVVSDVPLMIPVSTAHSIGMRAHEEISLLSSNLLRSARELVDIPVTYSHRLC